jgi:DNA-binding LytR/AlgR family response regulator
METHLKPGAIGVLVVDEWHIIPFEEIDYLEANRNYCKIYCYEKERPLIARATLKEIEAVLPEDKFSRIHESHIVSHKLFKKFNRPLTRLCIKKDIWLPISRKFRKKITECFALIKRSKS